MTYVNANVNVYVYDISVSSADFTVYTTGIGTLSLMQSHLLYGEFSIFSVANTMKKSPFFIPAGTHHC